MNLSAESTMRFLRALRVIAFFVVIGFAQMYAVTAAGTVTLKTSYRGTWQLNGGNAYGGGNCAANDEKALENCNDYRYETDQWPTWDQPYDPHWVKTQDWLPADKIPCITTQPYNGSSNWEWQCNYDTWDLIFSGVDKGPATNSVDMICPNGGSPLPSLGPQYAGPIPGWCIILGIAPPPAQPAPPPPAQTNAGPPEPSNPNQDAGDPINVGAGNLHYDYTDYKRGGPGPVPEITRSYNSSIANQISTESVNLGIPDQIMGPGWTSNLTGGHLSLIPTEQFYTCTGTDSSGNPVNYICPDASYPLSVLVWHADGSEDVFSGTVASTDESTPLGALTPTFGAKGQLSFGTIPVPMVLNGVNLPNQNGFTYLRRDGQLEYYSTTGLLLAIQDTSGQVTTYVYDSNYRLVSIATASQSTPSLSITYDSNGRISTITNAAGGKYTYSYDSNHGNLIQVIYPDNTSIQYVYENYMYPSALTGVIDEKGNRYATWTYDDQGRATSSQHAGGADNFVINSYGTDSSGNITSAVVTEPTGSQRTLSFTQVNGKSLLVSASALCTACGDNTQSASYDANGFVSSKTDFSGNQTTYIHDGFGNEVSRTEAANDSSLNPVTRTITTQWNYAVNRPALITEPGRTTAYTYDTDGRTLTKTVTDTASNVARVTTYTYNTAGLLRTIQDPMGNVTTYGYDNQGNLNSITDALNHPPTQITQIDSNGLPLTILDPNHVETDLTYDARQRLTSRTVAGNKTQFTYDAAGNLTQILFATGKYLNFSFDTAHRLTGVSDYFGNSISYTLDNLGNRTGEQTFDASGVLQKTLSRTFNSLNQLTQLVRGAGQTTQYSNFDGDGHAQTVTDPMGAPTSKSFDALNRLSAIVDPESGNTNFVYDALGRVQDVTDPKGLDTHYSYDAFGDVTQVISPDTGITNYSYDLDGNRLTKQDARGITTTYTYDALNRLTAIIYPDASRNVTYTYDQGTNIGRLTGMTDSSGTTSYSYDAHGNTTQKVVTSDNHVYTVSYQYDTADELVEMTYPSGMRVYYGRDNAGRVTSVTSDSASFVSGITYEPFGPIKSLTYGNQIFTETRSYDQDYRPTAIDAPGLMSWTLAHNADDDVTSITDGIDGGNNQTFGYDALNRLTSASGVYGSQGYAYDIVNVRDGYDGNRTLETFNGAATSLSYDAASNKLLTVGQQTYSYDATGNLVGDGSHTYNYDVTGRLTGHDSTTTAYLYNGLGQRTVKNPVDDISPTVVITSPAGGLVSGVVSVTASAEDEFGISSVQFQLDGTNLGPPLTTAPYTISWNTAVANQGPHTLTAIATDPAGNHTTSAPVTAYIPDTIAPSVAVTAPTAGAALKGTVSVTANASDNVAVESVQFLLDGADLGSPVTTAPYVVPWDTTTASIGAHTLVAIATDTSGNTATSAAVNVTVLDSTPPTVAITAPVSGPVSGTVTLTATASDNVGVTSVQFQLDGVNVGSQLTTASPYTITWDTTTAAAGTHSLTAIATDAAGNSTTSSPVIVTVPDTTPPTVALSSPANGGYASATVTVTATASDNVGVTSVQFQLDGADLGSPVTSAPYSTSWNTMGATGAHTLIAIASDAAGNTTTSSVVIVTVDNTPPTVSVTAPTNGVALKGAVNVSASAADDIAVASVQFQLDGVNLGAAQTSGPYNVSWDTTTAAGGNHVLTAVAKDSAGNVTTSSAVTVTVDNSPPGVSISAPAAGANLRGTLNLTANASASFGVGVTSVQFLVDGVNFGAPITSAPYSTSWDTTTASAGVHTLTAIATDGAGNTATSAAITVTVDNMPPTVSITAPSSGQVSGTVTVSASASDNIAVVSVQFQMDGANLGAPVTTAPYTYNWSTIQAVGSHVLTAIAADAAGNATTSTAVSVTVLDVTAPTVAIAGPIGPVAGTMNVTVSASDNVGVTSVQYQLDGANLGPVITAGPTFTYAWNTSGLSGNHTLKAIAKDAAGNPTTSAGVTVYPLPAPRAPTSFTIAGDVYTGATYSISDTGTFSMSFTAPPITGQTEQYRVYQSTNGGNSVWVDTFASTSSGTITRSLPAPGKSALAQGDYDVVIQACNVLNGVAVCGGETNNYRAVVMTTVPTKPTNMSISPSSSSNGIFTLSWTAPPATSQYRVYESANGGAYKWVDTFNDNGLGTISRVEPQSGSFAIGTYSFYVCAWNSNGCSPNSAVVTGSVIAPGGGGGGCPPPPYQCQLVMTDKYGALWMDPSIGLLPLDAPGSTRPTPTVAIATTWADDLDRRRPGPNPRSSIGIVDRIHKNEAQAVGRADA